MKLFEENILEFGVAFLSKVQKSEPIKKAPWADLSA